MAWLGWSTVSIFQPLLAGIDCSVSKTDRRRQRMVQTWNLALAREEMWVIFSGRKYLVKLTEGRQRRKKNPPYIRCVPETRLPLGN